MFKLFLMTFVVAGNAQALTHLDCQLHVTERNQVIPMVLGYGHGIPAQLSLRISEDNFSKTSSTLKVNDQLATKFDVTNVAPGTWQIIIYVNNEPVAATKSAIAYNKYGGAGTELPLSVLISELTISASCKAAETDNAS